ncbi:MAG: indolepyruvate oxidoreductase subunit beta [Eubacterium sp.]|nr:indolepyruvate oxidoreductase subunit beta [Eubacterium sp.]
MSINIVLCGVGGQGTVLASKIMAKAAMNKGLKVMSAETIGMAQRGGSVFSFLKIGDDLVSSMIGKGSADIILGFEPGETVRMLPYLKEGGSVVVNSRAVKPTTATLGGVDYRGEEMVDYLKDNISDLTIVDGDKACEELGSSKVLNVVLLGAAVRTGRLGLSEEDIKEAMKETVKEKFLELNYKALNYSA